MPPEPNQMSSPFHRKRLQFSVAIMPAQLHDPKTAIRKQLQRHLLQHTDAVGGVILALQPKFNVSSSIEAHILDEQAPIIYPNVTVDALVWSPLHVRIQGRVKEIFSSHCTVLALGYFSASIMPNEGFDFNENGECIEQSTGKQIVVGCLVEITCEKMYESEGIISLVGKKAALVPVGEE